MLGDVPHTLRGDVQEQPSDLTALCPLQNRNQFYGECRIHTVALQDSPEMGCCGCSSEGKIESRQGKLELCCLIYGYILHADWEVEVSYWSWSCHLAWSVVLA
jgi:hypothetical protein